MSFLYNTRENPENHETIESSDDEDNRCLREELINYSYTARFFL